MKALSLVLAVSSLVLALAAPAAAQLESINPLGADGDPLHAFSPPPPPPPAPYYVAPLRHKHHRHAT